MHWTDFDDLDEMEFPGITADYFQKEMEDPSEEEAYIAETFRDQ